MHKYCNIILLLYAYNLWLLKLCRYLMKPVFFCKFLFYKISLYELIFIYLKYHIVEGQLFIVLWVWLMFVHTCTHITNHNYFIFPSLLWFLNCYLFLCFNYLCRASSVFAGGIFPIRVVITLRAVRGRQSAGRSSGASPPCSANGCSPLALTFLAAVTQEMNQMAASLTLLLLPCLFTRLHGINGWRLKTFLSFCFFQFDSLSSRNWGSVSYTQLGLSFIWANDKGSRFSWSFGK